MPYETEITIAAIAAVGTLVYAARPRYTQRKTALLAKYRRIRTKSLKIQDALSKHVMENDTINDYITPEMTYGQFIKIIKKQHQQYLSEKTYVKLKNSTNIFFLNRTKRLLEEQEQRLIKFERQLPAPKDQIAV